MGLLKKFFNQTRKPEGFLGKIMVSGMNSGSHAKLANFGLSLLGEEPFDRIADFGCGGGRNVFELATRYPLSSVTGIDYSAVSVEQARKHNRKLGKRVEIFEGDVGNLSLPANQFDLATAFETVYFWPGLERCFLSVAKTMKKGGKFLITNESDGLDETGKKFEKIIDGMKLYTAKEIEEALKRAGFTILKSVHHEKNPWIAILAEKQGE